MVRHVITLLHLVPSVVVGVVTTLLIAHIAAEVAAVAMVAMVRVRMGRWLGGCLRVPMVVACIVTTLLEGVLWVAQVRSWIALGVGVIAAAKEGAAVWGC